MTTYLVLDNERPMLPLSWIKVCLKFASSLALLNILVLFLMSLTINKAFLK